MNEATDPALSDAEAWIESLLTQRRLVLNQVGVQEKQLFNLGYRWAKPTTAEIRKWWVEHQGCCPHCGKDLLGST
jgi:hypothetical protein